MTILKDFEVAWVEGNHDFNLFVKEKIIKLGKKLLST